MSSLKKGIWPILFAFFIVWSFCSCDTSNENLTLTIEVIGEGEVTPSAGNHIFTKNAIVHLEGIASDGWIFCHWIGDVTSPHNPQTTIVLEKSKSVTAVFKPLQISEYIEYSIDYALHLWDTWEITTLIRPVSWFYEGPLAQEEDYEDALSAMTDDTVYVPMFTEDGSITAVTLSHLTHDERVEWQTLVEEILMGARHRFSIAWEFIDTGLSFLTVTVSDEEEILWDSILGMISWSEEIPETIASLDCSKKLSGGETIYWIWGKKQGEILWEITCFEPLHGEHKVSAQMSLGEAQIDAHMEYTDDCCILHYGWAWRTPIGSIHIAWDDEKEEYDISVTGLGSSGHGAGSLTICCPQPIAYSGYGAIRDPGNNPVADVKIQLEGPDIEIIEVTTDSDGKWEHTLLYGDVLVTPNYRLYEEIVSFDPPSQTITQLTPVADFIAGPLHQSLSIAIIQGEGTTTPSPGSHSYFWGTEVSISAIPNEGWQLEKMVVRERGVVYGVVEHTSSTIHVSLESLVGGVEVDVYFEPVAFVGRGRVTDRSGRPLPHTIISFEGDEIEAQETTTDDEGYYEQDGLFGDSIEVTPWQEILGLPVPFDPPSQTITRLTPVADFIAGYLRQSLSITIIQGEGTTTPSPGDHSYSFGSEVAISAIPDEGWQLEKIVVRDLGVVDGVEHTSSTIHVSLESLLGGVIIDVYFEPIAFVGRGRVTDRSGRPLPHTIISFEGDEIEAQETTTDDEGYYEQDGLFGDSIEVTPWQEILGLPVPFDPPSQTITRLTPEADFIAGYLRQSLSITIIQGEGTTTPSPGSHSYSFGSEVAISAIPDEGWQLEKIVVRDLVVADGVEHTSSTIHVSLESLLGGVEVNVYFELVAFVGRGKVTDRSGRPLPHTIIYFEGDEIEAQETTTDDEGYYEQDGLYGDWIEVTPWQEILGLLVPFDPPSQTITRLTPAADFIAGPWNQPLFITIIKGEGTTTPSPGHHSYFWGTEVPISAIPDEGWQLEKMVIREPGVVNGVVEHTYPTIHVWLESLVGGVEVDVYFEPVVEFVGRGRVTDRSGRPLPHTIISFEGDEIEAQETTTDDEGYYEQDGLFGGQIEVSAWQEILGNPVPFNPPSQTITHRQPEANFLAGAEEQTVSIHIIEGRGTTTPYIGCNPGYLWGSEVIITAIPDEGWQLEKMVVTEIGYVEEVEYTSSPINIVLESLLGPTLVFVYFEPVATN